MPNPESALTNQKRHRRGWYLFDFANSVLVINGSLYFPQWIVGSDNKAGDLWFNLTFVISSLVLLAFAPMIGLVADRTGNRFSCLKTTSIGLVISGAVVGIAPIIVDRDARVTIALIAFFFVLVFYQLSLVFYNSMLNAVTDPDNDLRRSGFGLAFGWLGGVVAIFFGLIFTKGWLPSIGQAGMASILPSAIVTGLLTAIALWMMRGMDVTRSNQSRADSSPTTMKAAFRVLLSNRATLLFLISYLLFSDAILTLQNNSTIFMDQVHKFSDDAKAYLFLMVLVTGAMGALAVTFVANAIGLSKTLRLVLVGWIFVTIASGLVTDQGYFVILFGAMGLLNGAIWSVARVMFHRLVDEKIRNASFGIYSTFERFASILGPMAWSAFLYFGTGTERYQIAWAAMAIFIVISLFVLSSIRANTNKW